MISSNALILKSPLAFAAILLLTALGLFGLRAPDARAAGAIFTVNSAADTADGSCDAANCTLRDAIVASNNTPATAGSPNEVRFGIGSGAVTIAVGTPLPWLTQPVKIDGLTQPGGPSTCSSHSLRVQLAAIGNGTNGAGLRVESLAAGSTVRGLAIGGFSAVGVMLNSSGNTVDCNNIGTDLSGTAASANAAGVGINAASNTVSGNVISGNTLGGCQNGRAAVEVGGQVSANNNTITNNLIGVQANATTPLPNCRGVQLVNSNNNTLSQNTIAHNDAGSAYGFGVVVAPLYVNGQAVLPLPSGNRITQNRIFDNGPNGGPQGSGLGINANVNQQRPYLKQAVLSGVTTTLDLLVNGSAGTSVTVELFKNASCDAPNDAGEGQDYLGSLTVAIPPGGALPTSMSIGGLAADDVLTATGTGADGTTSLFSRCVRVLVPSQKTFVVNTTGPTTWSTDSCRAGSTCTLGDAILAADENPNAPGLLDEIRFNIPGAGPRVIDFGTGVGSSSVPFISEGVRIDGATQPGARCDATGRTILIEVRSTTPTQNAIGLNVGGSGTVIRGVAVTGFGAGGQGYGIRIDAANTTVECTNVGVESNGTTARANNTGVGVYNGPNNTIGGASPWLRNVISGNTGRGVHVWSTTGTKVAGNYIGTNEAGSAAVPNGSGATIEMGSNNTVGGQTPAERNVISGNANIGLNLLNTTGTRVIGNYIGISATGLASLANNSQGVMIQQGSNNTIGGQTAAERNVISGNSAAGVFLSNTTGNRVIGNYIGPDASGGGGLLAGSHNAQGVVLSSASGNAIGGHLPGEGNVISGNSLAGVLLQNSPGNNTVKGNFIGLAPDGQTALGNSRGINVQIGNGNVFSHNVIANNTNEGIIVGSSTVNTISQNGIHSNGGLGISTLSTATVAQPTISGGNLLLNTGASKIVKFEVFGSDVCDGSGAGEGQRYVMTVTTQADASGAASTTVPPGAGPFVTATATVDGATSAFSNCVPAGPYISSVSPGSAVAGTAADLEITITGSNFGATPEVVVNGESRPVTFATASQLTSSVPSSAFAGPGTVQVAVKSGLVMSNIGFVFVTGQAADVTSANGTTVTNASVTVSAGDGPVPSVSAAVTGTGTVAVANYESNPGTAPSFKTTGSFFDVYVAPSSSFSTVVVTYCDPNGGDVARWWNGSQWVVASPQSQDPVTKCITISVASSGTTPTIDQLQGTLFSAADTVAPSVTCDPPDTSPWYAADVNVTCVASDAATGLEDQADASFSLSTAGEGFGLLTGARTVCDVAGNCATAGPFGPYRVDTAPPFAAPTQAPAANGAGWNNTDATVNWNWADSGSGIDAANCTTISTSGGEGAITHGASCTDVSGKIGSATFSLLVDKTAPSAAISSPANLSVNPVGVAVAFTSTDALSGVASISATLANNTTDTAIDVMNGTVVNEPGVYVLTVVVTDRAGNTASETSLFVVYDPSAGYVTGGGWINSPVGAYVADPSLSGKATFGFVSQYKKGANVPTGNTQFQFHAAGLDFKSTSYEWLVVAGARAQYRGVGTINGRGDYAFFLTVIDGNAPGGGGTDRFRIRIWDRASGGLIYDNQLNAPDDADPTTVLGGGSIVIHKN